MMSGRVAAQIPPGNKAVGDLRKTIACGKIEMKMDVKMVSQEEPGGAWHENQVIFLPPGLETTGGINPRPALKGTETSRSAGR